MSRIFGRLGGLPVNALVAPDRTTPRYSDGRLFLASGGGKDSGLEEIPDRIGPTSPLWIVSGLGWMDSGGELHPLTRHDWRRFAGNPGNIPELGGHFLFLTYDGATLTVRNDNWGQRTLYYFESPEGFFLSTRLDDLLPYSPNPRLDLATYGKQHLLQVTASGKSWIDPIRTLPPGGVLTLGDSLRVTAKPFTPRPIQYSPGRLLDELRTIVFAPDLPERRYMLGLSGGADSRLLFGAMLSRKRPDWAAYTIRNDDHPDQIVAQKLAADYRIPHRRFPTPDPNTVSLDELRAAALRLHLWRPLEAWFTQDVQDLLAKEENTILDGDGGHYFRRNVFYRLEFSGALRRDFPWLSPEVLRSPAPWFLNEPSRMEMEAALAPAWEETLHSMPDPVEIGRGRWLDLLFLRHKLGVANAPMCAALDEAGPNHSPFNVLAQFHRSFSLPDRLYRHDRLVGRFLAELDPRLPKYPVARYGTTMPFGMHRAGQALWARWVGIRSKLYRDDFPERLLHRLAEPLLDALHSRGAASFEPYDHARIELELLRARNDEPVDARGLFRWFGFECWRETVDRPKSTRRKD
jgi:hypothetical protein